MEDDVRQRVRQILFYKNESVNSFCLKTTDNKKDYQAKQKRYNSQIKSCRTNVWNRKIFDNSRCKAYICNNYNPFKWCAYFNSKQDAGTY